MHEMEPGKQLVILKKTIELADIIWKFSIEFADVSISKCKGFEKLVETV